MVSFQKRSRRCRARFIGWNSSALMPPTCSIEPMWRSYSPANHFGDRLALRGQADPDRTAVDARALVADEAEVDQLLQIVGHVRAEIVAARAQFAGGQLRIADVEQQQRLDGIDVAAAVAVELILEALQLVERLHRRLLDVVKDEFDRNGRSDINAIQALLLFNIGNAELTAGELRSPRLLSRLECFLQSEETRRARLHLP